MKIKKILFILLIFQFGYSQNKIEIIYDYSSSPWVIKDVVSLLIENDKSQYVCDLKKKSEKYSFATIEREALFYVINYNIENNLIQEQRIANNKIGVQATWTNDTNWIITNETKNIKGYNVVKAYYNDKQFGNIEAWFTTDIPLSSGPARYVGLPGLILEVNTETLKITAKEIIVNPTSDFINVLKDKEVHEIGKDEIFIFNKDNFLKEIQKSKKKIQQTN